MGSIDKQKEKIAFWRIMFFFLLASIFGVVAFLFTKYEKLNEVQLILANIGGVVLVVALIATSVKLKTEIDNIEEM